MPISVGDSRTFYRGVMATSMADIMETCQRGMIDYTFLGGAQIDAYGNLNSTMIGSDYARPKVRLPGSGGANDLASLCWRILVVTNHDRRRFVEKLDFLTTPGYLTGPGAREAAGLPPGTGPYRVITDLAVLGYHEQPTAGCRCSACTPASRWSRCAPPPASTSAPREELSTTVAADRRGAAHPPRGSRSASLHPRPLSGERRDGWGGVCAYLPCDPSGSTSLRPPIRGVECRCWIGPAAKRNL